MADRLSDANVTNASEKSRTSHVCGSFHALSNTTGPALTVTLANHTFPVEPAGMMSGAATKAD